MEYRILGKTGLKVAAIGMGTWQLAGKPWGWDQPDEKESLRALERYVELGGNFIDTAYVYGGDNNDPSVTTSEQLIGRFIKSKGIRDQVIIATKIPGKNRKWPANVGIPISEVFPDDYIEEMVDASLKTLDVDVIDLMQFHVWLDDFAKEDGWKSTIQKITKAGKVKHWGISINDYQPSNCLKTLDTGLIDTIQLIFNIFHQKPIERLFPYAKAHNIGLIARVPLDEGSLSGKYTLDTRFTDPMHSVMFSPERLKELIPHIDKLKQLLNGEAKTLAELALRFILSFDAISAAIPGSRKVVNVEANAAVADGRKLSDDMIAELKKHAWERNWYVDFDPALKDTGYLEV